MNRGLAGWLHFCRPGAKASWVPKPENVEWAEVCVVAAVCIPRDGCFSADGSEDVVVTRCLHATRQPWGI